MASERYIYKTVNRHNICLEVINVFRQSFPADYTQFFALTPVPLWVKGFSGVERLIKEMHILIIENFCTFISSLPQFLLRYMQEIRTINANQQTLTLFGAQDKAQLPICLGDVFHGETRGSFAGQLIEFWQGSITLTPKVLSYRLGGDALNIHVQSAILPRYLPIGI